MKERGSPERKDREVEGGGDVTGKHKEANEKRRRDSSRSKIFVTCCLTSACYYAHDADVPVLTG